MTETRFYWIKKALEQKTASKILKVEIAFEEEMLATKCKDYEIRFEKHMKKIQRIIRKGAKEIKEWRKKLKEEKCLDETRVQEN